MLPLTDPSVATSQKEKKWDRPAEESGRELKKNRADTHTNDSDDLRAKQKKAKKKEKINPKPEVPPPIRLRLRFGGSS